MLIRVRAALSSVRVHSICLECFLVLFLVLALPLAIDGLDHDSFSVESALTHFVSPDDLLSFEIDTSIEAGIAHSIPLPDEYHRLPTDRHLVTRRSSSYL